MKFATIANNSTDGKLVLMSADGKRYLEPEHGTNMLTVIENWSVLEKEYLHLNTRLLSGEGLIASDLIFMAPLPRSWQWLDGSAFPSHGRLMQQAFNLPDLEYDKPLMYQGLSHHFYSGTEDIPFLSVDDGIDFEGEVGVIVDEVPMGITAKGALDHIKLIVLINDWSLRTLAPAEMKTGFGWIQAKPACSIAPFAITPEEAGSSWQNGRLHLDLRVQYNGNSFGHANAGAMEVGFHQLVAHAAATRTLCAGTLIGSGTVSNDNYKQVGSSCIAEKRGIEMIDHGNATTQFMNFNDHVQMQILGLDNISLFGEIVQRVVEHQ